MIDNFLELEKPHKEMSCISYTFSYDSHGVHKRSFTRPLLYLTIGVCKQSHMSFLGNLTEDVRKQCFTRRSYDVLHDTPFIESLTHGVCEQSLTQRL